MNLQEQLNRIQEMMGINTPNGIVVYHTSLKPIVDVDDRFLKVQSPRDKPEGLWFTYTPEKWGNFFYTSLPKEKLFVYQLKIDNSNFLILDSIEKINEFNDTFESDKPLFGESYGMIWTAPNWLKVKEIYDGVEFPNYEEIRADIDFSDVKNQWLTFIDINSGCLWNPRALKNIEQI